MYDGMIPGGGTADVR